MRRQRSQHVPGSVPVLAQRQGVDADRGGRIELIVREQDPLGLDELIPCDVVFAFDKLLCRWSDVEQTHTGVRVGFRLDGGRYVDCSIRDLVHAQWEVLAEEIVERIQLQRGIHGLVVSPRDARIQRRGEPHVETRIDDFHRVIQEERLVDQLLDVGTCRVSNRTDEPQLRDLVLHRVDDTHDLL